MHPRTSSNGGMKPIQPNVQRIRIAAIAIAATVFITFTAFRRSAPVRDERKDLCPNLNANLDILDSNSNPGSSATSGKLFEGTVVRTFDKANLLFQDANYAKGVKRMSFPQSCKKWSVVTTIFEPSEAVEKQAKLPKDWCMVIVGDMKTPKDYSIPGAKKENVIFLDLEGQDQFGQRFKDFYSILPWNSFARKNVGFLYAIAHGAKMIWDFDDDNFLLGDEVKGFDGEYIQALEVTDHKFISFNPYPLMGAPHLPCWPRGFPLTHIKEKQSYKYEISDCKLTKLPLSSVGFVQSLANSQPDVDGIYRLVMPIPFDFNSDMKDFVAVPKHAYSPLNAQASLIFENSLWMLYLPFTVHGRVSDIWRSYVYGRLAKDIGARIIFSPPLVRQDRNPHSYLADMQSEQQLYERSEALINVLDEFRFKSNTLPGRLEEIYVTLYERNIFQIQDVTAIQGWIKALLAAGYKFPDLKPSSGAVKTALHAPQF